MDSGIGVDGGDPTRGQDPSWVDPGSAHEAQPGFSARWGVGNGGVRGF